MTPERQEGRGEAVTEEEETATMARIVAVLSETFLDDGVAIWLGCSNHALGVKRPIEVCTSAEGRAQVLELAESLTGMVAT